MLTASRSHVSLLGCPSSYYATMNGMGWGVLLSRPAVKKKKRERDLATRPEELRSELKCIHFRIFVHVVLTRIPKLSLEFAGLFR